LFVEVLFLILAISVAGPVIGSLIGVVREPSELFMYNMLAFAAGVMLAISFLELIPEGVAYSGVWACSLGIFIGASVMYTVDKFIPHVHPAMGEEEPGFKLKRSAVYLILGIFIHNLPEGMAIATGTVSSTGSALVIALAIAIHNIPEGICTSAPYYKATGDRRKAFLLSSSTALPIILGFTLAYFIFQAIPDNVIGVIVAATAGLMIYISADELIPVSCTKDQECTNHSTIFSLIAGVVFVVLLGSL